MNIAISAAGLGKRYQLGQIGRASFLRGLRAWWKPARTVEHREEAQEFWALRDVSFAIGQGELVGVIGRNGAGKSTLLKLLSRVTAPTEGEVRLRGRLASLLEVGTGFHPDLTGRENLYLNGALLGMAKREIDRKFDEIVDFSGVEQFIDTPVKRYSSGMYVRLAFAVAAHLEPEILVVDEVLAVGDAQFQKKCLGKMGEVGKHGRTVLFVSHNMSAVARLCTRGILLERGRLVLDGKIDAVIRRYGGGEEVRDLTELQWSPAAQDPLPFSERVEIHQFSVRHRSGTVSEPTLYDSDEYEIVVDLEVKQPDARLIVGFACYDATSRDLLFTSDVHDAGDASFGDRPPGRYVLRAPLPRELLWNRSYEIELVSCFHYGGWILPSDNPSRMRFDYFRDTDRNPYTNDTRPGFLAPVLRWSVQPK